MEAQPGRASRQAGHVLEAGEGWLGVGRLRALGRERGWRSS